MLSLYTFLNSTPFLSTFLTHTSLADAPEPWQLYFQDSASPVMAGILNLHDSVMFYLVLIVFAVMWIIFAILYIFVGNPFSLKYLTHVTTLEIIWTITPAFVLIAIAFPSFQLLYLMDEVIDPAITLKAVGHQWYWSYEYSDYVNQNGAFINFDSYMVPTDDLNSGDLRLLEVDHPIVLPINTHIRFIITAADVLHSWAVPSLGIKIDAVPGRLNQTSALINREGTFYGQCSEICGVQHGFMPIVIQAVPMNSYSSYIHTLLQNI